MLIQSIKLENIRSYSFQEIEFPQGSFLLSGDIGSGKSTILSAIEFALFGIKRGDLSGNALLRHGKKEGSVELCFKVENKEIIIKRNLKKSKDDIKQDTGYIIIDGLKTEATAVELKTKVLELLGFPQDLVSKGKDMVYRYTVYTPQEQMKEILSGDVESRLDTLRRVFGIDKYKRIRENTLIISRFLKEKIKLYQGQTDDLSEKQQDKKQRKDEINAIEDKIKGLEPSIKNIKEKISLKKSDTLKIEKSIQEFNNLKKEISVNEANLSSKTSQLTRINEDLKQISRDISALSNEIKEKGDIGLESIQKDIIKRQEDIIKIEKKLKDLNKTISVLESKKNSSEELKQKISKIDECPTCLQEVSEEHKMFISQREDETIIDINENLKKINAERDALEKELDMLKQGLEKIRKKESQLSLIELKSIHLQEKTKSYEKLKKESEILEKQISETKNSISILKNKYQELKDIEKDYIIIKKEYDKLISEEKSLEISKAELLKEKETIEKLLLILENEISKKQETKLRLDDLKEKDNWLNKHFVNLVTTIEKHVMLKIHHEFSELFKEWFNIMIEDEAITARLDDSFTPIVEQDGYETEFINLSGGERTSLALAYRLSLNKVINNLIENIKIKDLIILDEPTDGFSTEQLDRVKVVLDQLDLKQVMIVSHESKIEGFVDTVIRVVKEGNISRVVL